MTTRERSRNGMMEKEFQPQKTGPPSPHSLKRYYRLDEVAAYFSIGVRTVYRLIDQEDLQVTRIRGCVRVSAEELRRFEAILADGGTF